MIGLPRWLSDRESACQFMRCGFDPWLGRSPGEENGNPLQYPLQYTCLGNLMSEGPGGLQSMGVTKSQTWLGSSVQFSRSVVSDSATPWTAACQASLSITHSRSLLKLMSIGSVMPSNHLILCHPLLLLPSIFPSIRVFSNELALHIRSPNIGASASASVLPMNIQDWFPLGLTCWSPCSPRDSQESSPTPQFKSFNSLALSFLYNSTLKSICDSCKNHSFD